MRTQSRDPQPDRASATTGTIVPASHPTRGEAEDDAATPGWIGSYEIREELGKGGMGVVYRAHDPRLERDVAIKLVRPRRGIADPARLRREALALAALSHPNVVQVYEVGVDHGRLFVAMEHVPGRDLRRWLETAPPRDEVLARLIEAGRGLVVALSTHLQRPVVSR